MIHAVHSLAIGALHCHASGDRMQNIDDLTESISKVGMTQPILIDKYFNVVSGRRRYAACVRLGLKSISTVQVNVEQDISDLMRVDGNLTQLALNSVEFDEAMLQRKEIYQRIFPESIDKIVNRVNPTFTEDTANKLNVSKRTVETSVRRAKGASDSVKKAQKDGLSTTKVNELSALPKEVQDKLLPEIKHRSIDEVKQIVADVKDVGLAEAQVKMLEADDSIGQISRDMKKLNRNLRIFLDSGRNIEVTKKDVIFVQSYLLNKTLRVFMDKMKEGIRAHKQFMHTHDQPTMTM
jgi:ParB family chromosome partitioning protein